MATIEERLEDATEKAESASAIADEWANGPEFVEVPTDSGLLPTIAEFQRRAGVQIDGVIEQVQVAADEAIDEVQQRLAGSDQEIAQAIQGLGWKIVSDFTTGGELNARNEVLYDFASQQYYRWEGEFPKIVPSESSPSDTGGVGPGAWVSVDTLSPNVRPVQGVDELRQQAGRFDGDTVHLVSYHEGQNKGGGVMVWDAASTAADDGGVTFAVTGVTTGRWVRLLDGFISIEMFGASDDGTTDISPIVQQIANILEEKGGTITAPAGNYLWNSTVSIGANVHLKFSKNARITKNSLIGAFIRNSLGTTSSTGGYNGNSNIAIEGGIWDANRQNFYRAMNFFEIGYCRNFVLKDTVCLNGCRAHVVDLSAVDGAIIEDNYFLGFAHERSTSDDSLGDDRTFSEVIQLDHCRPGTFAFGALDGTPCRNVKFNNNTVGPNPLNTDPRFGGWGVGIGTHGSVRGIYFEDIIVTNNVFYDCVYAGVRPWAWRNVNIAGNHFIGGLRGVHCTMALGNVWLEDIDGVVGAGYGCHDITISGNTFKNLTDIDVFATGGVDTSNNVIYHQNFTISGNTHRNSEQCYVLRGLDGLSVSSNVSRESFRFLFLSYGKNITITGGSCIDIQREGLFFNESQLPVELRNQGFSSNITVHGMVVENCGRWAFNFSGGVRGLTLSGLIGRGVSRDSETGGMISLNTNVNGAYIHGCSNYDNTNAIKPSFGLQITSTSSNVILGQNRFFGAVSAATIASNALGVVSPGDIITSPNGTQFQLTVDNSGVVSGVSI